MEDVETALPWYSDSEVLKYSKARSEPYGIDTVQRMYSYLKKSGDFYIIEIWENDFWKPIGDACLMKDSTPIVIGSPEYRSRGIGGRILSMLIDRALNPGWEEMHVKGIYSYNLRSIRLFASKGFVKTGESDRKDGITVYSYTLNLDGVNKERRGRVYWPGNRLKMQ